MINVRLALRKVLQLALFTIICNGYQRMAWATTVSNTYNGSLCHAISHDQELHMTRAAGTITGSTINDTIVCPIIKTTSGPGTTGDSISYVSVTDSVGKATCTLGVYNANKYQLNTDSNLQESASGNLYAKLRTITLFSTQDGYWEGYEDHDTWYYAELSCTFTQANSNIVSYTVVENGSNQPKYRISSGGNCTQSPETDASYNRYIGAPTTHGGYLQAVSNGTDESHFNADCPVLPSSTTLDYVEVSVGASINATHRMRCRNSYDTTYQYVASVGPTYELPPFNLTFSQSTPSDIICNIEPTSGTINGDGKVLSYRAASCSAAFADTTCP